ncbi:unnamed protein product [Didymodactylos carnosus]|uniref:Uncharacterized protein n=1 Tax=Didymodactylos carnosus TaxID=1234261 RepID=A0A8S2EH42_9BILA|nr:unnamed protein product [Didymodactylos carnosus]CAF3975239.1 unnamed protein product [Didymodactylos carnosus]
MAKAGGGISGHFSKQLIDRWCQAFSFRAILSSVVAEIVSLETGLNSLDTHIECTPTRIEIDNKDLSLCIAKLKSENLFSCEQKSLPKLFTGKIIHNDIVLNICNSYERGYELLKKYIVERLINKTVNVYDKIDFDFNNIFNHEFTNEPLSLSNKPFPMLLYQSSKSVVQKFLLDTFPNAFTSSIVLSKADEFVLIIDGGMLLQQHPPKIASKTLMNYSEQLLDYLTKGYFNDYNRIDIVFDSGRSKVIKSFIERHGSNIKRSEYILNKNSIPEVGEEFQKLTPAVPSLFLALHW